MGQRGPLRVVTDAEAERTGRKKRGGGRTAATVFAPRAPSPPTWLDREAKAEWGRIVPELDSKGLLAAVDRAMLATYCDTWSRWVDASKVLRSEGLLAAGQKGEDRKHPAMQVYRDLATQLAALAKELLLTPNVRLRSSLPEANNDEKEGDDILD